MIDDVHVTYDMSHMHSLIYIMSMSVIYYHSHINLMLLSSCLAALIVPSPTIYISYIDTANTK
jgi:hypothetical protein